MTMNIFPNKCIIKEEHYIKVEEGFFEEDGIEDFSKVDSLDTAESHTSFQTKKESQCRHEKEKQMEISESLFFEEKDFTFPAGMSKIRGLQEVNIELTLDVCQLPDDEMKSLCSESDDDDDDDDYCDAFEVQENKASETTQIETATSEAVSLEEEKLNGSSSSFRKPEVFTPKWKKKVFSTTLPDFAETVGPSEVLLPKGEVLPIHIFKNFFTKELIQHITFQTNLYATQEQKPYKAVTEKEIETFIGILVLNGIIRLPSYRDYWSSVPLTRIDVVANAMARERFDWLLSHIHLNDNQNAPKNGEDGYDKLYKLRPYLIALSERFRVCYNPTENQSIDEGMIKFKGRSSLKQYISRKPVKRGYYKVWIRASSNGYISQFDIYTGKKDDIQTETGLGSRVVCELVRPIEGKSYKIFANNFFSSFDLAKALLEKQTGYCGTLQPNRKNVPVMTEDKKMARGDSDFRMDESGISCAKWMGNKALLVVSSFHDPSKLELIARKQKDGTKKQFTCPSSNASYMKQIGYVDLANMLKSMYEIDIKSKKWWFRIFTHFLDVSLVNSFLIYQELFAQKGITLYQFRIRVIQGLMGCEGNKKRLRNDPQVNMPIKKRYKLTVPKEVRCDQASHLPTKITARRRCNFCSTKAAPHQTQWICETCDVALCLSGERNCFKSFHLST